MSGVELLAGKVAENGHRVVIFDRRNCGASDVVTNCKVKSQLQEPIKDPARFPWHEVKKVEHYYLSVDALTQPMLVREKPEQYLPQPDDS